MAEKNSAEKERRASQTAVDAGLSSEDDAAMLAKLGYKQELRRNFTMIEVFGIAFSIMGLLPSIASTLAFSLPAGPAGMVWSWFLASMFIFIVGLAMADLGSAMPTSGESYVNRVLKIRRPLTDNCLLEQAAYIGGRTSSHPQRLATRSPSS